MKKGGKAKQREKKQKIFKNIVNSVLVLALICSCFCYTSVMFRKANQQYEIRLQETGDELAKNVRNKINMEVEYLEGIAECMSNYEDIHCKEAVDTLVRVSEKSHFTRMWLTKADGAAISSELKTSDATGRKYLERAKNGESGISEVQNSRVNGERNVVLFAPTYYDGEVSGMVIGILRLDSLFEAIEVECFGGQGYCNIYTDAGDVLSSTDADYNFKDTDSKYGYSCDMNIQDWNIFVSLPDYVINGEIRFNIFITVMMCVICVLVFGVIIVNAFRERNRMLLEKASRDLLTALLNRGTIEDTVEEYVNSKRECDGAFMIFDVDKFKGINDTMGHDLGDYLLKQVAVQMRKVFGDADCLGRMGGDEFAILIKEVRDKDAMLQKVDTFRRNVELIPLKRDRKSTVSIGVTFIKSSREGGSFDNIYKMADQAMYKSKSYGGNVITVYEDEDED